VAIGHGVPDRDCGRRNFARPSVGLATCCNAAVPATPVPGRLFVPELASFQHSYNALKDCASATKVDIQGFVAQYLDLVSIRNHSRCEVFASRAGYHLKVEV
jgi:hypothetical protein